MFHLIKAVIVDSWNPSTSVVGVSQQANATGQMNVKINIDPVNYYLSHSTLNSTIPYTLTFGGTTVEEKVGGHDFAVTLEKTNSSEITKKALGDLIASINLSRSNPAGTYTDQIKISISPTD